MKKKWKWTLLGITVGILLIPPAAYFAGLWWLENQYLHKELKVGKNASVKFYGAQVRWNGRLQLDSVAYSSPEVHAFVKRVEFEMHLFPSLFPFMPRASLLLDSVNVHLTPQEDSVPKPKIDSLALPEFSIPIKARIVIRKSHITQDSGVLANITGLKLYNPDRQGIILKADSVQSPLAKGLSVAIESKMNWKQKDSLKAEMNLRFGSDQIQIKANHPKKNLLRGKQWAQLDLKSSKPYLLVLAPDAKAPVANDLKLEIKTQLGDSLSLAKANLNLKTRVTNFSDSMPLKVSPQQVDIKANWNKGLGEYELKSHGDLNEEVFLNGKIHSLDFPAADTTTPIYQKFGIKLRGYLRHFHVQVGQQNLPAAVEIEKLNWNGQKLETKLRTSDGSIVEALIQQQNSDWRGGFTVDLKPNERWLTAFTDTQIVFQTLYLKGKVAEKVVQITLAAKSPRVYGVSADSLHANFKLTPELYTLLPSKLLNKKEIWMLSGAFKPGTPKLEYWAKVESDGKGSIQVNQEKSGFLKAWLKNLKPGSFPYVAIPNLPVKNPNLDGHFYWNIQNRIGEVQLKINAEYKEKALQTEVVGHWDKQTMEVEKVFFKHRESQLTAKARITMHGRQFYDLKKVEIADVPFISIAAHQFDLPQVLSIALEDPPLNSGKMEGQLSYEVGKGFLGRITFDKVIPKRAKEDEAVLITLKNLSLSGNGDSLIVQGVTASESQPLLNDSLRIAVTQLFGEQQHIRAEVVAGKSLRLMMDAQSNRFRDLKGKLKLTGRLTLGEATGSLEDLQVDLDFAVPFKDALSKAELTTKAFNGRYVLPDLGEQKFSLNPTLKNGHLDLGDVRVINSQGEQLTGQIDYALIGKQALRASIKGDRFAIRLNADQTFDLKGIDIQVNRDTLFTRVSASLKQIQFQYADSPLRAEGVLENTRVQYYQPQVQKSDSGRSLNRYVRSEIPSLSVNTSIRDSYVRYRLKSLQAIQDLFKKSPPKKKAGRSQPMQMDISVKSLGDSNRVDSDILRLVWVGNVEMHGVQPYALFNGRINSLKGELGLENQAYAINQMTVKWLNAPLAEGEASLEAKKRLASDCKRAAVTSGTTDSCVVVTRLSGALPELQFEYDTDCGGGFGAGGSVAAMLFSVRRGCYDPALFTGGSGANYGQQAISLLEPTINNKLSSVMRRFTGKWIAATEVSGLSNLASGTKSETASESETASKSGTGAAQQAIRVQLVSREFMRLRLKMRSGYHNASQDLSNPWEHLMAIEWRPPIERVIDPGILLDRLQDHVRVVASIETKAVAIEPTLEEPIERKLGLNYNYDFWGIWLSKKKSKVSEDSASLRKSKPDAKRGLP